MRRYEGGFHAPGKILYPSICMTHWIISSNRAYHTLSAPSPWKATSAKSFTRGEWCNFVLNLGSFPTRAKWWYKSFSHVMIMYGFKSKGSKCSLSLGLKG